MSLFDRRKKKAVDAEAKRALELIEKVHEADIEADQAAKVIDRAWAERIERRLQDLEGEVAVLLRRRRA